MKSGRAAKWAAWIFKWEEDHEGYSKFLDWDEFQLAFWKDFCPAHSDTMAINELESTSYFQKACSIDDYLDECKGDCGAELNQILAGGPKLIYYNK